jgi:endonuclease YncB( thermonuclease family)
MVQTMRERAALAVCMTLALPVCVHAEIVGRARIIDGNSITLAGQCIRLAGIEAPATQQMCQAGGRTWFCGQEASFALARIIETHWVHCAGQARDAQGADQARDAQSAGQARGTQGAGQARDADGCLIAVCNLSGKTGPEVNAEMVREGWAHALLPAYRALEQQAREAGAGIWRGTSGQ